MYVGFSPGFSLENIYQELCYPNSRKLSVLPYTSPDSCAYAVRGLLPYLPSSIPLLIIKILLPRNVVCHT